LEAEGRPATAVGCVRRRPSIGSAGNCDLDELALTFPMWRAGEADCCRLRLGIVRHSPSRSSGSPNIAVSSAAADSGAVADSATTAASTAVDATPSTASTGVFEGAAVLVGWQEGHPACKN